MCRCSSSQVLLLIVLRCGLELILQSIFFSNSKSVPSLEGCCKQKMFLYVVWKAAARAERSRQLYFSKELVFSGDIQAVYLHKSIWTNPDYFCIWHVGSSHFRCHLSHLSLPITLRGLTGSSPREEEPCAHHHCKRSSLLQFVSSKSAAGNMVPSILRSREYQTTKLLQTFFASRHSFHFYLE